MQSPTSWLSKQQLVEGGTLLLLQTSNAWNVATLLHTSKAWIVATNTVLATPLATPECVHGGQLPRAP
jgi:hypothetical protein